MTESTVESPPRKTSKRGTATKSKRAKTETTKQRAKSSSKSTSVKKRETSAVLPMITIEERYRLIAESAYYKAQERHFAGGDNLRDWLEAEAEIDSRYQTAKPR